MKAVITQQKYKCDFCKRRSVKAAMEKHEKRCFRNPNRFCDTCENTGKVKEWIDGPHGDLVAQEFPCMYCSKRDPEIEKGIAEYEAKIAPKEQEIPLKDIPF